MTTFDIPFPTLHSPCVLALGTFDGVHIGHAAVISRAVDESKKRGVASAVWCFATVPRAFFGGDVAPICTPDEKARRICALGVDVLIMPPVTADLLSMTPRDFVDSLVASLSPCHVVCGFNYTFGAHASGNTDTLRALLDKRGISLTVVEPVTRGGIPVSSTLIRQLIESGDTKSARELLGYDA